MPELRTLQDTPQNSKLQIDSLIRDVGTRPACHVAAHHFYRDAIHLQASEHRTEWPHALTLGLYTSRSKTGDALCQVLFGGLFKTEPGKLLAASAKLSLRGLRYQFLFFFLSLP